MKRSASSLGSVGSFFFLSLFYAQFSTTLGHSFYFIFFFIVFILFHFILYCGWRTFLSSSFCLLFWSVKEIINFPASKNSFPIFFLVAAFAVLASHSDNASGLIWYFRSVLSVSCAASFSLYLSPAQFSLRRFILSSITSETWVLT